MTNVKAEGFTLIEVVIAFAIISVSLVMVLQLYAGGLKAARTTCDYTRAVIFAKDKMEELSDAPVNDRGEFEEGFRWESEVNTYKELEESDYNLLKIKVKVLWPDVSSNERSVELVSLKTVPKEEKL